MSDVIVSIENLWHKYAKDWAVKDVSFEINKNEILGFLGSNGAGKSTTMNILCGVLNQTKGSVKINDIDVAKHPVEAKKLIGFLPQKAPVYTEFTVAEYLEYAAELRSIPKKEIKKAIDMALEKCEITHFKDRLIGNLSGGYQQRVGLAQAIIHDPLLIVLDEPTNGLDPVNIKGVRQLIKEFGSDHAIILSTHILPEVEVTCDKVNMIEKGQLVFQGTIDEFKNHLKPNTIILQFTEDPGDLSPLSQLKGVTNIASLEAKKYRVTFESTSSISSKLISSCVKAGLNLSEAYVEKNSLEDVFTRISKEETV